MSKTSADYPAGSKEMKQGQEDGGEYTGRGTLGAPFLVSLPTNEKFAASGHEWPSS